MPWKVKLTAITLDCADPSALAAFYQQFTGLELPAWSRTGRREACASA
jgi:hypothetical protein